MLEVIFEDEAEEGGLTGTAKSTDEEALEQAEMHIRTIVFGLGNDGAVHAGCVDSSS